MLVVLLAGGSVTGNVGGSVASVAGNVGGSVNSVNNTVTVGQVTVATNNDKTAYSYRRRTDRSRESYRANGATGTPAADPLRAISSSLGSFYLRGD
jgi:hypothetical protein